MVDTKSCDYSNSGRVSECGYAGVFFGTRQSPTKDYFFNGFLKIEKYILYLATDASLV